MWFFFFFYPARDTETGADSLVSVVVESWSGSDRSLHCSCYRRDGRINVDLICLCCLCELFHSFYTSKGEVTLTGGGHDWQYFLCNEGGAAVTAHGHQMEAEQHIFTDSQWEAPTILPMALTCKPRTFSIFSLICQAVYC